MCIVNVNFWQSTSYYVCSADAAVALLASKVLIFKSLSELSLLEPICCKKRQKIVPDQLLVCGVGDF